MKIWVLIALCLVLSVVQCSYFKPEPSCEEREISSEEMQACKIKREHRDRSPVFMRR
jgi:hypothetical protein